MKRAYNTYHLQRPVVYRLDSSPRLDLQPSMMPVSRQMHSSFLLMVSRTAFSYSMNSSSCYRYSSSSRSRYSASSWDSLSSDWLILCRESRRRRFSSCARSNSYRSVWILLLWVFIFSSMEAVLDEGLPSSLMVSASLRWDSVCDNCIYNYCILARICSLCLPSWSASSSYWSIICRNQSICFLVLQICASLSLPSSSAFPRPSLASRSHPALLLSASFARSSRCSRLTVSSSLSLSNLVISLMQSSIMTVSSSFCLCSAFSNLDLRMFLS